MNSKEKEDKKGGTKEVKLSVKERKKNQSTSSREGRKNRAKI